MILELWLGLGITVWEWDFLFSTLSKLRVVVWVRVNGLGKGFCHLILISYLDKEIGLELLYFL